LGRFAASVGPLRRVRRRAT